MEPTPSTPRVETRVPVTTPACMVCGRTSTLEVDARAYDSWKRGALVQVAFAQESEELREMLITGLHPDCWDSLWDEHL